MKIWWMTSGYMFRMNGRRSSILNVLISSRGTKTNICPVWTPTTVHLTVWCTKLSKCPSFCNRDSVHAEHYVTDYASCPFYLRCVFLSSGYLGSTLLVAAGSSRQSWLLHALLVIMIVTIITPLISETVALIVIVIACLVFESMPFLVLASLLVVSDKCN